jgi:FecR protein
MTDYLWDGSGTPDPEVEELERTLAPLRFPAKRWQPPASRFPIRYRVYAAIAASLVLALVGSRWLLRPVETPWSVSGLEGKVQVGYRAAKDQGRLYVGQTVRTGNLSHATLEAEDFGEVELKADSEMRIVETGEHSQRMDLRRGHIHALIWAPPREFVVDTPSSKTIDLGCQYDLTVDESGDGFLTVETGWVAFQFQGKEAFIPAGAACRTSVRRGPGIPFFQNSSSDFRDALHRYESSGDRSALKSVLNDARPEDGLTLWHLMTRVSDQDRPAVFDRYTVLVKLPPSVNRERALARDRETLDECWNALNLDSAEWWRAWKRDWR